jgi:hypothetical protein
VQFLCWHIFYDALTHIIEYASRAIALHNAMFTEKRYSFLMCIQGFDYDMYSGDLPDLGSLGCITVTVTYRILDPWVVLL